MFSKGKKAARSIGSSPPLPPSPNPLRPGENTFPQWLGTINVTSVFQKLKPLHTNWHTSPAFLVKPPSRPQSYARGEQHFCCLSSRADNNIIGCLEFILAPARNSWGFYGERSTISSPHRCAVRMCIVDWKSKYAKFFLTPIPVPPLRTSRRRQNCAELPLQEPRPSQCGGVPPPPPKCTCPGDLTQASGPGTCGPAPGRGPAPSTPRLETPGVLPGPGKELGGPGLNAALNAGPPGPLLKAPCTLLGPSRRGIPPNGG